MLECLGLSHADDKIRVCVKFELGRKGVFHKEIYENFALL